MKKKPTATKRKGSVSPETKRMTAVVKAKQEANGKARVKKHYLTPYLLEAVARVLTMPRITKPEARNSDSVVVIDARKVVRTVKPSLVIRPDNTVRARLISLAGIKGMGKVGEVGYLRLLPNNHPDIIKGTDEAYQVILFHAK